MIAIRHADIHLIDLQTRLPFKYGIATMTSAPHAFVRVEIDVDGRQATGIAADHLPPKWFTKVADKSLDAEIDEMLRVIEHAVEIAIGTKGDSVFDVWRQLDEAQTAWARENELPPLLSNFGTSLVERAAIEAFCKSVGKPFAAALRENVFGIRLGEIDERAEGAEPADLLPAEPRRRVIARHTIGMADPLVAAEIAADDRLDDGLPQALEECIARYGLKHFKVKVSGNINADVERLQGVAKVIAAGAGGDYAFTMDGNEQFRSLEQFQDFWQNIRATEQLQPFFEHLLFVEQPFHRDVALSADELGQLSYWRERPRIIIDESDATNDSLSQALALGYQGTSHKNCKGVFHGVINACLLERFRRDQPSGVYILSGEDLANIGPVALLQDLAVAATLGIESIERNGHHYFAGLSAFPEDVQQQVLEHHGDLYEQSAAGWPTLAIRGGELGLDTVLQAPLGVGFELDVEQFASRDEWRKQFRDKQQSDMGPGR